MGKGNEEGKFKYDAEVFELEWMKETLVDAD